MICFAVLTSIRQISRPGCLPTSAPNGDSGILNAFISIVLNYSNVNVAESQ